MAQNTLLGALLRNESGGRNIPNTHQGTSSGRAEGYFQITTGTWREFAQQAGIDLNQYPTPMTAADGSPVPYAVQARVAAQIPLKRWDESTIKMMRGTGRPIDVNRTLGENLAMNQEGFDAGSPVGTGRYDPRSDSPSYARPTGADVVKYATEHPPGPGGDVVTTSPYNLPAPGTVNNPLITKEAKNPFEKVGAAVAKLGDRDQGSTLGGIQNVPNPPLTALPAMSSIDPVSANNQRNAMVAALMRLNSGQLWPMMGGGYGQSG
jgi:hypothetical protein